MEEITDGMTEYVSYVRYTGVWVFQEVQVMNRVWSDRVGEEVVICSWEVRQP